MAQGRGQAANSAEAQVQEQARWVQESAPSSSSLGASPCYLVERVAISAAEQRTR